MLIVGRTTAAARMHTLLSFLLGFSCFLSVASHQLTCSVTQSGNRTRCTITDPSHVLGPDLEHCEYSWLTENKTKLKHHKPKHEQVKNNPIDFLDIEGCIHVVYFERNCVSEHQLFSAICNNTCSAIASPIEDNGHFPRWKIAIIVSVSLVPIAVLGLAGFCVCKKRKSKSIDGKGREQYSSVKMEVIPNKIEFLSDV